MIPIKVSNFHKLLLQYWKIIFTHNFSPHGSSQRNNRVITIKRKSLLKSDCYEKGIVFVNDIFDDNGKFLEHIAFYKSKLYSERI